MGLSPRHLVFALPLWAAAIGAAVARASRAASPLAMAVGAVASSRSLAVLSPPGGVRDPREWPNVVLGGGPDATATGSRERLDAPADWLRETVDEGDLLLPVLVGLPRRAAGDRGGGLAPVLPRRRCSKRRRPAERSRPAAVVVAVPVGEAPVDLERLESELGDGYEVRLFPWLAPRPRRGAVPGARGRRWRRRRPSSERRWTPWRSTATRSFASTSSAAGPRARRSPRSARREEGLTKRRCASSDVRQTS